MPLARKESSPHPSHISLRIRMLREERNMSQRELARASGLSPNTLSLIERERTSPTASTLQKLATALGVSINAFFEPYDSVPQHITFTRKGSRPRVQFAQGEAQDLGPPGAESFPVTPLIVTLAPDALSGAMMTHSGQEFVYCLSGEVLYQIGSDAFLLKPGDSLLFNAERPHRWQNPSSAPVEVLIVLCLAHGSTEWPPQAIPPGE